MKIVLATTLLTALAFAGCEKNAGGRPLPQHETLKVLKWDMTRAGVESAFPGTKYIDALPNEEELMVSELPAVVKVQDVEFTPWIYYSESGGLNTLALRNDTGAVDSSQAAAVLDLLKSKYGAPVSEENDKIAIAAKWKTKDAVISLMFLGSTGFIRIMYSNPENLTEI